MWQQVQFVVILLAVWTGILLLKYQAELDKAHDVFSTFTHTQNKTLFLIHHLKNVEWDHLIIAHMLR
jgi:hypothetical protein